ncbi:MAG TPA: 4Fe-4S binding protein [Firmicutes bacterium]|nr:4Fe-4S binding protein [Bacillota bacterium]
MKGDEGISGNLSRVREVQVALVAPERCHRCLLCIYRCPTGNIRLVGDELVCGEECLACGNCVEVCSRRALRLVVKG